jgi:hypothetical protein
MKLPADMPNMDVNVERIALLDQYGSSAQLFADFKGRYKEKVTYSAVWSIILSYAAALLKGVWNAVLWLFRGPFDALTVARETRHMQPKRKRRCWEEIIACGGICDKVLWWVSPLIHGLSEGMYRALAELIGNSIFVVVLILNAIRHLILGATRKRATSILDGVLYGIHGLVLDTLVTPFTQLYHQTTVAYQDWGKSMVVLVFLLCVVRILLCMGPILGVFHFLACFAEGLANALLHEDAQYAQFEARRKTESVIYDPMTDENSIPLDDIDEVMSPERQETGWFSRAKEVTDDEVVMQAIAAPVQRALNL